MWAIAFPYDACDRLVSKEVAGGITRYTYDAAGHVIALASPSCTMELARDALGRLLTETVDGRTTRYSYGAAGRVVRRTTPTGAVSQAAYDAAGPAYRPAQQRTRAVLCP
nr:RHS repeat protein [Streptomyces sp. NBC_00857]